jgi:hypothetical protein
MEAHLAIRTLVLLVSLVPLAWAGGGPAAAQPEAVVRGEALPVEPVNVDRRYEAYGFVFEDYEGHDGLGRFTEHQIQVLGVAIEAYAGLAGGPEQLNALVDGPVSVRRDLHGVVSYTQAGRVIGLGRGAFDLAETIENNYYAWGAESGDELAQIVFGHEVGHRWIEALRRRDGVDRAEAYRRTIWRGERLSSGAAWATLGDAEEEAVTNLALYALGKRYRWTFLHDAPATEARQVWIDGWVHDLVAGS